MFDAWSKYLVFTIFSTIVDNIIVSKRWLSKTTHFTVLGITYLSITARLSLYRMNKMCIKNRTTYKYNIYYFSLLENKLSVNIIFTIEYLCEGEDNCVPTYSWKWLEKLELENKPPNGNIIITTYYNSVLSLLCEFRQKYNVINRSDLIDRQLHPIL